jgi:hypothetical protein
VSSNTSHLSQFDNLTIYTRQILSYIFITTCITLGIKMNTFEEIAQALSPIVEHSETINLWRYDLGARPSPALLDEISDSLEDALFILKSAIAEERKNAKPNQ